MLGAISIQKQTTSLRSKGPSPMTSPSLRGTCQRIIAITVAKWGTGREIVLKRNNAADPAEVATGPTKAGVVATAVAMVDVVVVMGRELPTQHPIQRNTRPKNHGRRPSLSPVNRRPR